MVTLMVDVDERSRVAGWPFTPRPDAGFAASIAFNPTGEIIDAFKSGFVDLAELVGGELPYVEAAIEQIRAHATYL